MAAPKKKRGIDKRPVFLAAFRKTASVTRAARAARVERNQHYKWLAEPEYKADWEKARIEAAQHLEDEAVRRAVQGVLEPVFYQGERCGAVRVYSDGLMQCLLKAWKPNEYRDRATVEHSGAKGGPIVVAADPRLANLTDDELDRLHCLARKLAEPAVDRGGADAPPQTAD